MSPWIEVFGRLHPLILHAPIGLLLGLAGLEAWAVVRRGAAPAEWTRVLAWLAAGSAVLAAGTGYVLSREDGYGSEAVTRHLQLGLALAGASVVTAVLRSRGGATAAGGGATAPRGARASGGATVSGAAPTASGGATVSGIARASDAGTLAVGGATWAYRAALLVTLGLMLPAGHIGASITHGKGFVTEPLGAKRTPAAKPPSALPTTPPGSTTESPPAGSDAPESTTLESNPPATPTGGSLTYATTISPIFASRCTSCHGETKTKADLALHTPDAILKGGESGPIFVAGRPQESEIMRRLRLPADDRDHMPPENKPQLSPEEVALLDAWILAGAPFDGAFDASGSASGSRGQRADSTGKSAPSGVESSGSDLPDASGQIARTEVRGSVAPAPSDVSAPLVVPAPPPSPDAVASLRARLIHVEAVAQGSNELLIDFAAPALQITDADVQALLAPLKLNVADLSLGRSGITDASMDFVAQLPNLRRLDVRRTAITDAGVAKLVGLTRLEELIVAQTRLTDAAVDSLLAMPALRRVYVWRSGLSADAAARLRRERGALVVDNGDAPDSTPTEAEQVVLLGKPAPVTTPSELLKPMNANCPVTGKPVDPKYVIVFEGKVIGFCCPNCPGQFWAEPGKYEVKP